MEFLTSKDINLPITFGIDPSLTKLEREFEEKKQKFLKLDNNPDSKEYKQLRAELFRIEEEIDSLLWG
jgi:hypothetical protein